MYKLIKKVSDFLFRFGKDRYIHFAFSLILTQLFTAVLLLVGTGNWSLFVGPALVLILGFAKEWMDETNGGEFEPFDIVWDFLGMFVALVLMILVAAGL